MIKKFNNFQKIEQTIVIYHADQITRDIIIGSSFAVAPTSDLPFRILSAILLSPLKFIHLCWVSHTSARCFWRDRLY